MFGFDWHSFVSAFLMFLGTYFGAKHGSTNGSK